MNQTNPQPNSSSPIVPVMIMMGVFALVLAILLSGRTYVQPTAVAAASTVEATPTLVSVIESNAPVYTVSDVNAGRNTFQAVCAACHGADAKGIIGNGKTLVGSEFVESLDDQGLLAFLIVGRQPWDPGNTTGIAMPARGGNPMMTDTDLLHVIAYIRTLNDPSIVPVESAPSDTSAAQPTTEAPAATVEAPVVEPTATTAAPTATTPAVSQPTAVPATAVPTEAAALEPLEYTEANFTAGEAAYNTSCASCHHTAGEGMAGMAPNLVTSEFVSTSTDADLNHFIMVTGRTAWDPANTTGLACPAKGTNFALTDTEANQIIVYLRGLQGAEAPADETAPATEEAAVETAVETEDAAVEAVVETNADYNLLCINCHAADGSGVAGLAQPLSASTIMADDEALRDLIVRGQTVARTTVPHPAYRTLTTKQVDDLVEYVKTLGE